MTKQKLFIAIVELKYEVIAVADSADKAQKLACSKALKELRANGCISTENNTMQKIIDYYGCNVTSLDLNTAGLLNFDN